METLIREYEDKDMEGCLAAFKSNVPKFFTEAEINLFHGFLENFNSEIINGKYFKKTYYYVITEEENIIGCGGFGYNDQTNALSLAWGLVHRDFHKKGLGEKLLTYRFQQIKKIYPETRIIIDTTQYTYTFFEKYGFVTTKITNDYYAPGMHRYDMILESRDR
jgi:predicted GNAT family N-acyltransferase